MRRLAAAALLLLASAGCASRFVTVKRYDEDVRTIAVGIQTQTEVNLALLNLIKAQKAKLDEVRDDTKQRLDDTVDTIHALTRTFNQRLEVLEKAVKVKTKFGSKPIKAVK